jgi:hypothetical protein
MTVEYLVLGVVVILVGIGQIYFRHFAGGDDAGAAERRQVPTRRGTAGGRFWQGWTAVLGFIGVAFGIALVVLGVLGR